jgi:hypothetical protein
MTKSLQWTWSQMAKVSKQTEKQRSDASFHLWSHLSNSAPCFKLLKRISGTHIVLPVITRRPLLIRVSKAFCKRRRPLFPLDNPRSFCWAFQFRDTCCISFAELIKVGASCHIHIIIASSNMTHIPEPDYDSLSFKPSQPSQRLRRVNGFSNLRQELGKSIHKVAVSDEKSTLSSPQVEERVSWSFSLVRLPRNNAQSRVKTKTL